MGLKVNFSQQEADSAPREVLPSGEYNCRVVDIETRDVKPGSENVGKPYWAIRFVVDEGKYSGNSLFSNIMLFEGKDGTLSSLSQFLRALGYDVTAGEFELPDDEDISGKLLTVIGRKLAAGYDKKAGKDLPDRFKVTGYKRTNVGSVKTSGNSSLLP